jgi:hypothetical protein
VNKSKTPRYSLSISLLLQITLSALFDRPRSFQRDATRLIGRLQPPLKVYGKEHIPEEGNFILTVNHYTRPGFGAWWIALAASAVLEQEVHWMMTNAWTFPGKWYARLLRPLSQRIFARLAKIYSFTTTPPMPPDPAEAQARAEAVRHVLQAARQSPRPVLGLSPEGRDFPGGALGQPPYGVGRFIYQLFRTGYVILPAGVHEENGALCIRFGKPYKLGHPHSHATGEIDPKTFRLITQRQIDLLLNRTIMRRIAVLLPKRLRGAFDL